MNSKDQQKENNITVDAACRFDHSGSSGPRVIAIGDIHGCSDALELLLNEISPEKDDIIVALGDFVDRGPNSARVIEILLDLVTTCHFVPLIGNHELMMFKGLRDQHEFNFWFEHGGSQTLASYGGRIQNIPEHHLMFLSHCLRFFETKDHFFVHASYIPELVLPDQPDEILFWEHVTNHIPAPHISGKTAVVGHTPQVNGEIRNLGHIQIIDTHCYGEGWLTAVDFNSNTVWQANNFGEFRMGQMPPVEKKKVVIRLPLNHPANSDHIDNLPASFKLNLSGIS